MSELTDAQIDRIVAAILTAGVAAANPGTTNAAVRYYGETLAVIADQSVSPPR